VRQRRVADAVDDDAAPGRLERHRDDEAAFGRFGDDRACAVGDAGHREERVEPHRRDLASGEQGRRLDELLGERAQRLESERLRRRHFTVDDERRAAHD
jgi:hypothetical protein